ncbi:MAG: c-type cytochrome [Acidimicrobiia bacterium]
MTRTLAALCLILVGACTRQPPPDATGAEIYTAVCAGCHTEDLSGGIGPALGPGSNAAAQDDEFLLLTVTRGRGRMPSFETTLSPEQIERVVEYLRSRQSAEAS